MSARHSTHEHKALSASEDKALKPAEDKAVEAEVVEAPLADGIEIVVAHYTSSYPELVPGQTVRLPPADANRLIVAGLARLSGA